MLTNVIVKCFVVVATIGLSVPAHAERLATILLKEGVTTKLAIYAAECGAEGYHECVRADLGCERQGEFMASVFGYSGKEAAVVLAQDDGKGSVAFGSKRFALRSESLQYSDMDGDWYAVLRLSDASADVWDAAAKATPIAISLGRKTISMPQTDASRKDLAALVKGCGSKK